MRSFKKYLLIAAFAALVMQLSAQESTKPSAIDNGWYVGISGSVPAGLSTFTSFGHEAKHPGYLPGLFVGYRINPVISVEGFVKKGYSLLSARECCIMHDYWLSDDFHHSVGAVPGQEGWYYSSLNNKVRMDQAGIQANFNVLPLLGASTQRWTLDLSPAVSALGTKTTITAPAQNITVVDKETKIHAAVAGYIQAGYQITKCLNLAAFAGFTYVTGNYIDAIPAYVHHNNYIAEGGLKLTIKFGKKQAKAAPVVAAVPVAAAAAAAAPVAEKKEEVKEEKKAEAAPAVKEEVVKAREVVEFPPIYFAFDKSEIVGEELKKAEQIYDILANDKEIKVSINGWCDKVGTSEYNARLSVRRAEALKSFLVNKGIDESRITIAGNGSDFENPEAAKARRIDCVDVTLSK